VTAHAELEQTVTGAGWDTVDGDSDATDPLTGRNPGHGTGTASVAVSRTALEVTGSAPEAVLMPIRAVTSVVEITQVTVAAAIDWAVDHAAPVITMSLGGLPSMSLHRALRRAVAADVIVLAAAGNCVRTVVWPARYDECVAVAGTDARDHMWEGSCRGSAVDVAAPAQNVYRATVPAGGPPGAAIGQGQGTSFAVALTAGVAALWLAHHGRDTIVREAHARGETVHALFVRLLRATARRPDGWDGSDLGAGVVDARGLLAADLDLGRGAATAVTAALTADPREVAGRSVRSLVAETVSAAAADEPAFDWDRHGAELAAVLLDRQLGVPGLRPEAPSAAVVSPQLAADVTNPDLRAALRLDESVPAEVKSGDPA
jgi:serine protease